MVDPLDDPQGFTEEIQRRASVQPRPVYLSVDARALVAGLVAPSNEVCHEGIYASDQAWDEVREAFPVSVFWTWARRHPGQYGLDEDGVGYDPGE